MLSGLAVFAAVALLQSATVGNSPVRYLPFHIWSQGYFAYLLALLHALDRSAAVALQAFRPVLVFDKLERGEVRTFEELDYRLTTLPPRPAMLAAVLGGLLGTALPLLFVQSRLPGSMLARAAAQFGFSTQPAVLTTALLTGIGSTAIAGVFVYHTIYQLRWIDRIYRQYTNVNLYWLPPLFSFSRTTALTAAVLAFVLPLWGIHRRLAAAKEEAISEVLRRLDACYQAVNQAVDRAEFALNEQLGRTIGLLISQHDQLKAISTWPWRPGTLRGFGSALLLPVALWLLPQVMVRMIWGV